MELPAWAFLNCYALLLAGMLLHTSLSASVSVRRAPSNRTYIRFLIVLISLLIMDSFSRLTTTENNYIYVLMQIGNFYIFAIDPLGYLLALNYLNCFIDSPDFPLQVLASSVSRLFLLESHPGDHLGMLPSRLVLLF